MQKLLVLLMTIAISLATSPVALKGKNFPNLVENQETKTFNLSPFNSVKTFQAIEVEIVKSDVEKAEVSSNYLSDVKIEVKNKTLYIQYKPNVSLKNPNTKVIVYAKDLAKVDAENASSVKVKSIFDNAEQTFECQSAGKIVANSKASVVHINAESASEFSGKIEAKNVTINATSASKINLSGTTNTIKVEATSLAKVNLEELKYNNIQKKTGSLAKIYTQ